MSPFSAPLSINFEEIRAAELAIATAAKARNTLIAYRSGWRLFSTWCEAAGYSSLPASPVACKDFCTWSILQGYRLQTIASRLSAVSYYHREGGFARPFDGSLSAYILNARRALQEEAGGKAAIDYGLLARLIEHLPCTTTGTRNRAMILLAFASGWRRSEVVALRFRDLQFCADGMRLYLRASKTDQHGTGRFVGIQPGNRAETCPVAAMREWLELRGSWAGPLFVRVTPGGRVTQDGFESRGEVLKESLKAALHSLGENARRFGAHSLRAGMITEAVKNGASEAAIMQRTGHRSSRTLQRYIRPATAFAFNPLRDVL